MTDFEQIKIVVPKREKIVISHCKRLSAQRLLSKTFIRLMKADAERNNTSENEKLPN